MDYQSILVHVHIYKYLRTYPVYRFHPSVLDVWRLTDLPPSLSLTFPSLSLPDLPPPPLQLEKDKVSAECSLSSLQGRYDKLNKSYEEVVREDKRRSARREDQKVAGRHTYTQRG